MDLSKDHFIEFEDVKIQEKSIDIKNENIYFGTLHNSYVNFIKISSLKISKNFEYYNLLL